MSKKVADEIILGLREAIGYVEGRTAKGMRVRVSLQGAAGRARGQKPGRNEGTRPTGSRGNRPQRRTDRMA